MADPKTAAKAAPKLQAITFTKPYGRYSRGDTAGFAAEEAKQMIAKGVAIEGRGLPKKETTTDGNDH